MSPEIVSELAPTGVLRAGINLSNFLLVTGRSATGDPQGVAPDLAGEIASRLGVPIKYVPFKSPGELADAAGTGVWDIGLIGAEPQRAEKIVFTAAYCEIEATYLVPAGSKLRTIADVDASGVRIAVTARSAYGLWLDRNIKHATLVRTDTLDSAYEQFASRQARSARRLAPAPSDRCGEASRRAHHRRQIHSGSAGRRHLAEKQGGRGLPARLCRRGEIIRAGRQADRTPQCARPFGRTESQPPAPVVGRDLPQGNSIATF